VITRFPAEKLMVAGAHYFTVDGPLSTTREHEAAPNTHVKEMVAGAKREGVAATD
jgi:Xaa-Pro aminopeptidase